MLRSALPAAGWPVVFACLITVLLAGCPAHKPEAPPAPEVTVLTIAPTPATYTEDYVAQTEAINTVEVRARVGGVLERQLPDEGEQIKSGQLLFVIDQQPYIAALAQARATLAQSQAALEQSRRDLGRAQSLSQIDAVSQQELDATVAKNKANIASVAAGDAAVKTAELNLGYTSISSPIDGVMGRAELRIGGLVNANSTLLTTLYQTNRMYVNLSISEQRLLSLQRQIGRAPSQNTKDPPPFRLFLADGSEYAEAPKLNFIDPAVDTRTGTLAIRLEVANPQRLLHAGEFARVQVTTLQDPKAIVVPQRAIQELQGQNYVWVLDGAGKAQQRDVRMGPRIGEDWLVQQGLKVGDRLIVDGVQRLKPGTVVKPTPFTPEPPNPKTAAPAGLGS
jgi:membrane fusion protein, multidrug efflux system